MLGKLKHGIEIEPRQPHLNASVLGDPPDRLVVMRARLVRISP